MIELDNLSHFYDDKKLFSDLTVSFSEGIHAIMGKSGTGKTTLLKIIAGLIDPATGISSADTPISVSFQENRLFPWYTALQNVSIVSDIQTANKLLTELELGDAVGKKPAELSGGMKRRVSLARALAAPSKTILLDEPFSGLDSDTALKALEIIRKYSRGKTVLIATHNLEIAKQLDSIIEI